MSGARMKPLVPEHVHPLVKVALLPLTLPLAVLLTLGLAVEDAIADALRLIAGSHD